MDEEFLEKLHVMEEKQKRSLAFLENLISKINAKRVCLEVLAETPMEPQWQEPVISSSTPKRIHPDADGSGEFPNSTISIFESSEGVSSSSGHSLLNDSWQNSLSPIDYI
uniref:Uncharacterized protein n=1 Tax=Bactrocera latifrons TaxID=174628 RepID=A0A0K8VFU0_BACLA